MQAKKQLKQVQLPQQQQIAGGTGMIIIRKPPRP